jgi:light-regulated signal transduction histidine kinase (bacteriophytochrome)
MSELLENFAHEYIGALEAYLGAGDEFALSRAYELGRHAMVDGLGILDVAAVHHIGLESLVLSAVATDRSRFAGAAADFFRELLSPFEMSFRGYRGANEQLLRLNETLRGQKEAVEFANRELESFSYSVSHDLRSPLLSIDGFSHILLEDHADVLDEEGKKYLLKICEAAKRMSQLIDDLLSLARVKLTEIQHANVDLTAIARGVAGRLQAQSPERVGEFIIRGGMHAMGDKGLLSVLLENLLGNAWKFSSKRQHAEVAFDCEQRNGKTTYFVRDNGAGFDMAYAAKLFSTFQRLHAASEFEGTGIGLAIVQRVVHRHEGRVWAEGRIDGGATFYFTLGDGHTS